MGFFRSMFGIGRSQGSSANPSQMHSQLSSGMSLQPPQSVSQAQATRRELLRVVLRDTLNRHGIPTAWIFPELVSTTSRNGERGIHWRLHVKHWDPRLLEHCVALQNALIKRVLAFDPLATHWLNGISWQVSLVDESMCPPLPPAQSWTMQQQRVAEAAPATEAPPAAKGNASADVIEGPVHIGVKSSDARADLDQLLAARDEDFRRHAGDATAPMFARTEPAKL